ncbi:hypothetical protein [Pseudomonas chlororaphis]|uniref:hypothetical protein n=1 Tax=Pseudomonas chlororaphis TaxID=587753 RepID=UPI0015DE52E1|nr:hypothetical protein [Pseudomonas chlororaphis]QLL16008.1 hypothetical protein H0I86_13350 [Pseudomonas chlororaphis subsp. aurantiaca]
MTGYSLDELLVWMDGKSKTLGWDALVSYDQAKINMLMEQQYVSKVGAEQIIPPITQRISGTGVTSVITGMVLGNPLLSFESADLQNSRANLTMPFLAGTYTAEIRSTGVPVHIDKMSTVVPGCNYVLTMGIDLQGSTGAINGQGEVFLDLGTGVDFKVNFVDTPEEQERIGNEFKRLYLDAPDKKRKYILGMLDAVGDYALTPQKFYIRTQPAPGANLRGSASYGEGAVVLFVKTKASIREPEGTFPSLGSDFRYLIPNNTDQTGKALYSGTVLIASRTLFTSLLAPYYSSLLSDAEFIVVNGGTNDLACKLEVREGAYQSGEPFFHQYSWLGPDNVGYISQFWSGHTRYIEERVPVTLPCKGLDIGSTNGMLKVKWANESDQPGTRYVYTQRFGPKEGANSNDQKYIHVSFDSEGVSHAEVGAENMVFFVQNSDLSREKVLVSNTGWMNLNDETDIIIANQLTEITKNSTHHICSATVPQIDLFTLANLLFPEKNTLQLTSANLPGDLACFGQLASERSSFRITPLQPVVVAEQTQQFRVDPPVYTSEPVTWSVRAVTDGLPGSIDANGLYRAPSAVAGASAHQDIITATIGTGTGLKQASAVAVVVNHAITVNPAFKLYDPVVGGVELSAATQGASVEWRIVSGGGTLTTSTGLSTTFTAPPATSAPAQVSVIEARDAEQGDIGRSTVLTLKSGTMLGLEIIPVSIEVRGPSAQIQLNVLNDEANSSAYQWEVLSGGGIVKDGLYTAPELVEDSCAIVWVTLAYGSMRLYGYAVIPLKR